LIYAFLFLYFSGVELNWGPCTIFIMQYWNSL
jgi:hypothetical protein